MENNIKQLPKRPKTFEEYNRERITDEQRINEQNIRLKELEAKNEALRVSKENEQAELMETMKSLAGMIPTLNNVKNIQFDIAKKVTEVHAVQTAYTDAKPKKALTRKEIKAKEEEEYQESRRRIHLKVIEKAGLSRK